MKKKILAVVLMTTMCISLLAGCNSNAVAPATEETKAPVAEAKEEAPAPETEKVQNVEVAVAEEGFDASKYDGQLAWYYPFPHPFGEACKEGAEAYVKETGVPINIVIGPEFTMQSELENIEAMEAQGYKYFMVFSVDAAAADGMYEEGAQKGYVFNNIGWGTSDDTAAWSLVSTNIYESAYKAMEYVGEKLGYKGGVMLTYETLTDAACQDRKRAVEDYCKDHPDMKVVAEAFDVTTVAEASSKIENTLNANVGNVDAIVSLGFTCTQALVTTLGDYYDRGGEKMVCIGIDTDDLIFEGIKNDILDATVAQNSWGIGYISGEVLRLEAEGYTMKDGCYHIDTGIVMVDKNNLDTYNNDLEAVTKDIVENLTTQYMEKK